MVSRLSDHAIGATSPLVMNPTNGASRRLARSRAAYSPRLPLAAALFAAALAAPLVAPAAPVITSFTASPATITSGQSSTLSWVVSGATSLSINQGVGTVAGTSTTVTPTATTIYTLTATGPDGSASATTGVALGSTTYRYLDIYTDALQGNWRLGNWNDPTTNLAATPPGRSGSAIETTFTADWQGFGLGDTGDDWDLTDHFLTETKVLEFDICFAGTTGADALEFILDDSDTTDSRTITSFITGWSTMTTAQRYGQWHHVVITFADLHPTIASFFRFIFFNGVGGARPHFYVDNVRLGLAADTLPPSITLGAPAVAYDQLLLPFTTTEAATYRIEYGHDDYSRTLSGPADAWATTHNPVLTGLTRGATVQYRIVATDPSGNSGFLTGTAAIVDPPPPTTASVTIAVDPVNTHTISPWIYGMNFYQDSAAAIRNLTINRLGGNRWTAYNWENNASNSGADWGPYSSDSYLGGGTTPAEAVRGVIAADRTRGNASIFTVQMQGYVAADKNGLVTLNFPTHLAQRFKQVVFKKPIATAGAFTTTPSTTDASVYIDEFVWAMNQKIPGLYTDPVNPTFILLDNEPELWPDTHAEIQQSPISVADYLAKTIALTKAIKDVAPGVKTFGPVHYGYNGIVNWQNTTSYTFTSDYWFTDKYLADMRTASEADGRRLLDVYNFHWYSESRTGGTRVTSLVGPNLTEAQIQAIVQSPRSLWDPTYTEDSWVAQHLGGPVRILARLKEKIAARWPGTGLAITEWANGGGNHIAGALAVADNLGIFGQQGLFMASMWPDGEASNHSFDLAGFKMYRDFDGALASFGDLCLPTVSSNTALVSAYVSRDSAQPGRHVIVAINRSATSQAVNFTGLGLAGTARLYRMTGASLDPVFVGNATVDLTTWIVALPAYSITTIEITAAARRLRHLARRELHRRRPDQRCHLRPRCRSRWLRAVQPRPLRLRPSRPRRRREPDHPRHRHRRRRELPHPHLPAPHHRGRPHLHA